MAYFASLMIDTGLTINISTGRYDRQVSCWDNIINSEKGTPFDQPKPVPLEGLFDDAAVEDQGIEDKGT